MLTNHSGQVYKVDMQASILNPYGEILEPTQANHPILISLVDLEVLVAPEAMEALEALDGLEVLVAREAREALDGLEALVAQEGCQTYHL